MFRNSHNSRGTSAQAGNPAPRWRRVFMALVLAIVVGSAGYAVPAQAQDELTHWVVVNNPEPITVCVRQSRDYRVSIGQQQYDSMELRPGTTITPVVADPSIITPTGIHDESINNPNPKLIWPHIVVFTFKAKREGRTTITFNADLVEFGHTFKTQPYTVDVNVQECKFKVSIHSVWNVPGLEIVAVFDQAELTPDANGNYTGTATVTWLGSWDVIPPGVAPGSGIACTAKLTTALPTSLAYLTGKMNDSGYLEVNITYLSSAASWSAVCTKAGGSTPPFINGIPLTAASLKISVPAAYGGGSTPPQELIGQIGERDSSTWVDIIPDTTKQRP